MNWCVYPRTALGAAVLQLHPFQLKMGKGQRDTGPCSRWESKKTLGDSSKGARRGTGSAGDSRGSLSMAIYKKEKKKKRPRMFSTQQRGKVFQATPHPRPSPSRNSRPGFPTCRMLMPRERKGERDGTGSERNSGQRWEGMKRGRRSHCLATVPGHVHG